MCHRRVVRVSYSTKILISTSLTKPVSRTHESYNIKHLCCRNYIEPFFNILRLMCRQETGTVLCGSNLQVTV